ncbi:MULTISPECIES: glutathione synthase [unclassified Zymobacter]|uniref:glutathione synthase n=1 Tax=unclassified Zymobacter TaxID=3048685 RepID=UPI0039C2FCAB
MAHALKIGIVMDPIANITYRKDSSLSLLWAAKRRGWSLYYLEQEDLYLDQGRAFGRVRDLDVFEDPEHWFELSEPRAMPLAELDVILMRKDPPVDRAFLDATHLLGFAEREGVLVVNPTTVLRECNEKLFAQQFTDCIVPTVVSSNKEILKAFHREHRDVIFKPLDGMGGSGIFRITEDGRNLGSVIEQLTELGHYQIMAQRFIPEITEGDTRIVVIDGEAVPFGLARLPAEGEVRGNLAAGGHGVVRALNDRDRELVARVAPVLKEKGIIIAGLDVIGGYITEINVTSPTCFREIDAQEGTDISGRVMDAIARRMAARA